MVKLVTNSDLLNGNKNRNNGRAVKTSPKEIISKAREYSTPSCHFNQNHKLLLQTSLQNRMKLLLAGLYILKQLNGMMN